MSKAEATMSEHVRSSITIAATPGEVMDVIADFTAYPAWATGITSADILDRGHDDGRAVKVLWRIASGPVTDEQVHTYQWNGDRSVTWLLDDSRMLRTLHGSYVLTPVPGGHTEVTYILRLELKVPLLDVLKRRAEKIIIGSALTRLKHRVEHLHHTPHPTR
ncbi:SRPBCC family protein [Actinokineospora sp. HUAS TT18]|uniref:SRPBCC family protein n=1 Tax=Actinokineospora sp. HUAS TT18 TaxID=3447451 RepID=UPI003F528D88